MSSAVTNQGRNPPAARTASARTRNVQRWVRVWPAFNSEVTSSAAGPQSRSAIGWPLLVIVENRPQTAPKSGWSFSHATCRASRPGG